MNGNEISRLAHAVNELRPDWPISSLTTWLTRNLASRPYRDAAIALVYVALDLKADGTWATDRPARVLEAGPWWRAAAVDSSDAGTRPHPVKPGQDCPHHPGQPGDNCRGCAADRLAGDEPPDPSWEPGDASTWADRIRAGLEGAS